MALALDALSFSSDVTPSPAQIALALTIVKSKPAGVTATDYVLQLRSQLKRGQQDSSELGQSRYFDTVAYWQQRCETAERRNRELESKVIRAERASQLFGHQDIDVDEQRASSSSKRKRDASPARRAKRTKASQLKVTSAEETLEDTFDSLDELGEDGQVLVEHMWTFQRLFRRPEADSDAICSSLVGTASALGRVLKVISRCHDRLASRTKERPGLPILGQEKSEFACSLSACARAFGMVLMGMNSLNEDSPGKSLLGRVIYECVKMFARGLEAIEAAAQQTAARQTPTPQTTAQTKKKSSPVPSSTVKESGAARGIAHFLTGVLGYLEKSDPLHQQLFDGFAFVLFERVGKHLYFCTFGRSRSTTIEGNIAPPPTPTHPADVVRQETTALAIRFEVKALTIILERAIGVAPIHMNPQTAKNGNVARLGRTISMKNLATSRTRLSSFAKDRLQRTLITCMFGEKTDDDFLDIIRMPVHMGSLRSIPKMEDKDVDEWFQRQVWRLVGWDLLGRENEQT